MTGVVIRDFIPAGEKQTNAEKEEQNRLRGMGTGNRASSDFVPGPGHTLLAGSGSADQMQEAVERAMASQAAAAREEYDKAVLRLKGLNVAQAIEAITQAPAAVGELLIVAEAMNGNRKSILQHFGEPDPAAVKHWTELVNGAPNKVAEAAVAVTEGTEQSKAEVIEE